jgi:hypothetical protein
MIDSKYMDKGAEIRDLSYEEAVRESLKDIPMDSSCMEIAYTPLDLIMACQLELPEEVPN